MRVGGIQPQDLVQLRVKDRVVYGEVLEVADGIVRFRPLCPAAGWHRATARQVVGHWRKAGRGTSNGTTSPTPAALTVPSTTPAPEARDPRTNPQLKGNEARNGRLPPMKHDRGCWLLHPHEQTTLRGRPRRTRATVLRGSAAG
jgi:hypothetical protein